MTVSTPKSGDVSLSSEELTKFLAWQAQNKTQDRDPVVFGDWDSGTERIRVYFDYYKGRELLSCRKFYKDRDTGKWCPGKGLVFLYEDIQSLIEGLTKMKEWCEEQPMTL